MLLGGLSLFGDAQGDSLLSVAIINTRTTSNLEERADLAYSL